MGDLRRDRRFRIKVPAILHKGKNQISLLTEDVSFRGIYLPTDHPPPVRSLVDLRVLLPPDQRELRLHAMVVHVVPPGKEGRRSCGVGLELYGLNSTQREAWDDFIRYLQRLMPESVGEAISLAPADAPDPVRRSFPRYVAELRVRLRTVDELFDLVTQDVSKGGMFIKTPLDIPTGSKLLLHLLHPEDDSTSFPLEAHVKRRVPRVALPEGNVPGLGVEFLDMDDRRREALFDFIKEHLHAELDDADFIEESGE